MYDDILGDEQKPVEQTTENIMEAMKINIKEKEKLIQDLTKQITELERQVEDLISL